MRSTTVTPFALVDELIHGELARSVADGDWFTLRGEHVFVGYGYPAAIAPAWLGDSIDRSYEQAKLINAALMSLAAVPVYLWARRLAGDLGGLIAAALTLCLPWYALTATLLPESLFFPPLFLLALYAAARAVEQPGPGWVGVFLIALILATVTRVEGLILVPILVTSAVAAAIASRRPVQLRPYTPVGAALVITAAVYVAVKLATGDSLTDLGVYEGIRDAHYSVGAQLGWAIDNLGVLVIASGIAPAIALLAILIGRPRRPDHKAFLAVAFSTVVWLVALTAFASSWAPMGVKERYLFYAAPVLFIALALWIERDLRAPQWAVAIAGAAVIVLVAAVPLRRLVDDPAVTVGSFGLVFVRRFADSVGGIGTVRILLGLLAVGAAAAIVLVPRGWRALVAAGVGAFLVLSSIPVVRSLGDESRRARDRAALPKNPSWMDAAVGPGAHALFLDTSDLEPEKRHGSVRQRFTPVWESEFWNRSFDGVVSLGAKEPAPLPNKTTMLDWATGSIVGLESDFVLARPRFAVDGRLLARASDLQLWRVGGPVQLASATEGVSAAGRAERLAAYSRWAVGPGRMEVRVSRGPARVRIGALGAASPGGAKIVLETGRRRRAEAGGRTHSLRRAAGAVPGRGARRARRQGGVPVRPWLTSGVRPPGPAAAGQASNGRVRGSDPVVAAAGGRSSAGRSSSAAPPPTDGSSGSPPRRRSPRPGSASRRSPARCRSRGSTAPGSCSSSRLRASSRGRAPRSAGRSSATTPGATSTVASPTSAFAAVGLFVGALVPRAPRTVALGLTALLAVVAAWALAGKAVPGWFPDLRRVARLRDPVGYWNALALLLAAALPLALAHLPERGGRARAALATTLFYGSTVALLLTFSRAGTAVAALVVAVFLAAVRPRLRALLVVLAATPSAVGVAVLSAAGPELDGALFVLVFLAGAALTVAAADLCRPPLEPGLGAARASRSGGRRGRRRGRARREGRRALRLVARVHEPRAAWPGRGPRRVAQLGQPLDVVARGVDALEAGAAHGPGCGLVRSGAPPDPEERAQRHRAALDAAPVPRRARARRPGAPHRGRAGDDRRRPARRARRARPPGRRRPRPASARIRPARARRLRLGLRRGHGPDALRRRRPRRARAGGRSRAPPARGRRRRRRRPGGALLALGAVAGRPARLPQRAARRRRPRRGRRQGALRPPAEPAVAGAVLGLGRGGVHRRRRRDGAPPLRGRRRAPARELGDVVPARPLRVRHRPLPASVLRPRPGLRPRPAGPRRDAGRRARPGQEAAAGVSRR